MAFKRFTDVGGVFRPRASIRTVGQLGLNKGSVRKYSIEKYGYAVLYYDDEKKRIGIELTNEPDADGAVVIHVRDGGGTIATKSFLNCFGIDYSRKVINDLEVEVVDGKRLLTFSSVKTSVNPKQPKTDTK